MKGWYHVKMNCSQKESNMYEPIRQLLNSLGFIVRGEVKKCDIAAIRDGEVWVVEMKLSPNLTLLYQAIERKSITNFVFIAIPRPKNIRNKNFASLKKIISKLELGLILVSVDSPVPIAEIVMHPSVSGKTNKQKEELIRKEILGRSSDTTGGVVKAAISTAYREKCVKIACLLETKGALNSRELRKLGCEKDTAVILRNNYYEWFEINAEKKYILTNAGKDYLKVNETTPLVAYYITQTI